MKVYISPQGGREGTFRGTIASNDPEIEKAKQTQYAIVRPDVFGVNSKGEIEKLEGEIYYAKNINDYNSNVYRQTVDTKKYPYASLQEATTDQKILSLEKQYKDQLSQDKTYTSLADQISALSGSQTKQPAATTQNMNVNPVTQNPSVAALSSSSDYSTSPLSNKLNFQVSDQQILDDYNNTKLGRLNNVVQQGNTQVAGIQERLTAANKLLAQLPKTDARYTSSKVYVDQLNSDLKSVTDAIAGANKQIKDFKPIAVGTPEAAGQITSFREYLQLPEENATKQLRQIDPESYKTAVALGQRYRQMATAPVGETKSAQTEQLRNQIEQEAMNQLALGSQLGAEEQRQYQQAARAAQTARGNIFGVAPAVEEAVTTGAAGEQRKLARYGAAAQFLGSGQTTSDALKADISFRDALLQNRLGAASGFIAGGPSLYNLGQTRTAQQQNAMQNYIQANQALPGSFGQAPSTASNFYQTTNPNTPTDLTNAFNSLYNSIAGYQSSTYGNYVNAAANQPTAAQQFGQIATGIGNLSGYFGSPSSNAFIR